MALVYVSFQYLWKYSRSSDSLSYVDEALLDNAVPCLHPPPSLESPGHWTWEWRKPDKELGYDLNKGCWSLVPWIFMTLSETPRGITNNCVPIGSWSQSDGVLYSTAGLGRTLSYPDCLGAVGSAPLNLLFSRAEHRFPVCGESCCLAIHSIGHLHSNLVPLPFLGPFFSDLPWLEDVPFLWAGREWSGIRVYFSCIPERSSWSRRSVLRYFYCFSDCFPQFQIIHFNECQVTAAKGCREEKESLLNICKVEQLIQFSLWFFFHSLKLHGSLHCWPVVHSYFLNYVQYVILAVLSRNWK